MRRTPPTRSHTPRFAPGLAAAHALLTWARVTVCLVWCALCLVAAPAAHAEPVTLDPFELTRTEEGLMLSFATRFELSRPVEDALQKGVPLFFVAEAEVFRGRWYWRDKRVSSASRTWRLTYQPLTRKYRVSFGGLNQSFDHLPDALGSLNRATHWKLADASQLDDGRHYVEFSYQLDTTQMPRPMQIGIGGQPEWALRVERVQRLN